MLFGLGGQSFLSPNGGEYYTPRPLIRAIIRLLVGRTGEVLGLADGSVVRGPLFRVIDGTEGIVDLEDGAASIEPDRTGRTFRIANFHSLLRDVYLPLKPII